MIIRIYTKTRQLLEAIKFEHSVFALPFAYIGMVLAEQGLPDLRSFFWITCAMVSARTLAMTSNRIIDATIDFNNPRTRGRAIPAGIISKKALAAMGIIAAVIFFIAAGMLNPLCLALSPVALVVVIGYSYSKRFTWMSHIILGWADGIAPVGGWIGVRGTMDLEAVLLAGGVAAWIAGFDIIYSCQDVDFDKKNGLHSIPQRWGTRIALRISRIFHLIAMVCFVSVGVWLGISWPYFLGLLIATGLMIYEHRLVKPEDLSKVNMAFFNVNGYISVVVMVCCLVAVYV